MMEKQIISKGEYRHYQIDDFISVKQYIFLRAEEKKCLTLRFTNSLGCKVNAFKFLLIQIDIQGNVIGKKKIKINNIIFEDGSDYTSSKGIVVDEKCVDFKIQMLCVYSERYRYKLKNNKVAIYYVPHKKWEYEDDDLHKDSIKVKSKTKFRTPSVRLISFLVVIAMIFLALSPLTTFFAKRIVKNLKTMLEKNREKKKAAATAQVEESSILEDVVYETKE